MIDMDMFYRIHILSDKMSAEQIAETTVRSWQARESWAPRQVVNQRETKIGPYEPMICAALTEYPRYTAQQMFQMICREGYDGKYTQVKKFVRSIRPKMQKAYLQITYRWVVFAAKPIFL